ncbi:MAG TPA: hypothetical protein PKE55_00785 [Kiritimatiellia bacterium]|nr:hypothetical protein [Kiritimatiellia bacterium]
MKAFFAALFRRSGPDIAANRARWMDQEHVGQPEGGRVAVSLARLLTEKHGAELVEAFRTTQHDLMLVVHVRAGKAHALRQDRFRKIRPMYAEGFETWMYRAPTKRARNWLLAWQYANEKKKRDTTQTGENE